MKGRYIFAAFAFLAAVSCEESNPAEKTADVDMGKAPIAFSVKSATRAVTETVAQTVETGGFWVTATTGAAGAEAQYSDLLDKKFELSGSVYKGGYYWPATGNLNFYAIYPQKAATVAATGVTYAVAADDGDVILAVKKDAANATTCALEFDHVFTRLYDIKLRTADADLKATVKSVKVTPAYKEGTLDATAGTITGTTAGEESAITLRSDLPEVTSDEAGVYIDNEAHDNVDRIMIPSSVHLEVEYTAAKPGFSKDYTKKADIALSSYKGQKVVITGILDASDASEIAFSITVHDWGGPVEVDAGF